MTWNNKSDIKHLYDQLLAHVLPNNWQLGYPVTGRPLLPSSLSLVLLLASLSLPSEGFQDELWNNANQWGAAFAPWAASWSVTLLRGTALTPTSGRRCSRYHTRQTSELMIHWSCSRRTSSDSIRCWDPVAFFFRLHPNINPCAWRDMIKTNTKRKKSRVTHQMTNSFTDLRSHASSVHSTSVLQRRKFFCLGKLMIVWIHLFVLYPLFPSICIHPFVLCVHPQKRLYYQITPL